MSFVHMRVTALRLFIVIMDLIRQAIHVETLIAIPTLLLRPMAP